MTNINLKYRRFQYKLKNHLRKMLIINKNKLKLNLSHLKITQMHLQKD